MYLGNSMWRSCNKWGPVKHFKNEEVLSQLRMVYKAEDLAKSSLTGKTSNAFKEKVAKPKLPNVDSIIGNFFQVILWMLTFIVRIYDIGK